MADEKENEIKTTQQTQLEKDLKIKESAYLIGGKMKDLILEEIKILRNKLELEKEIIQQNSNLYTELLDDTNNLLRNKYIDIANTKCNIAIIKNNIYERIRIKYRKAFFRKQEFS